MENYRAYNRPHSRSMFREIRIFIVRFNIFLANIIIEKGMLFYYEEILLFTEIKRRRKRRVKMLPMTQESSSLERSIQILRPNLLGQIQKTWMRMVR